MLFLLLHCSLFASIENGNFFQLTGLYTICPGILYTYISLCSVQYAVCIICQQIHRMCRPPMALHTYVCTYTVVYQ